MKRILLIEDSGDLSYDIKQELDALYVIKQADSYLSSLGMWERYKGNFDCIILDLNINPEGLSPDVSGSYFPIISLPFMLEIGWKEKFNRNIKVIVYSAYIHEFKVICSRKGISYSGMELIEKTDTSFHKLINFIKSNI